MKTIAIALLLMGFYFSSFAQLTGYTAKYNLTICSTSRNATAVLYIKDSVGNYFSGILHVDDTDRKVFGWHTERISEGGGFVYNTKGLAFYVDLKDKFHYNQLFRGTFNYDNTIISGTYFFWGNEFIFNGTRDFSVTNNEVINAQESMVKIYPNPVDDILNIDMEASVSTCKVFDMNGRFILEKQFSKELNVSNLKTGSYILEVVNNQNKVERIKFVKN